MATFQLNDDEWNSLYGLPHMSWLIYFYLRRNMNFETAFVGRPPKKISYQAIREALYVNPHQGIKGGSPSEQQIRSNLVWLEKRGLISRNKVLNEGNRELIFELLKADRGYCNQNKVNTKSTDEHNSKPTGLEDNNYNAFGSIDSDKANSAETAKVNTPQLSDIYNNNYNTRARDLFSMHGDWLPDEKIISMARRAGLAIPIDGLPSDILGEFINYWLTRPNVERTQDQWQHALINSIKKREVQNASTNNYKQGSKSKLDWYKNATEEF